MTDQRIDYPGLLQQALLGLVCEVLARTAKEGLAGEHYFYLTFETGHAGVILPATLREIYPDEMTVVLQHQFWDLEVDPESFSVTLRFGGVPQRITVPFQALTQFVDPVAEFKLRLGPAEGTALEAEEAEPTEPPAEAETADRPSTEGSPGANVVSLDEFRKK